MVREYDLKKAGFDFMGYTFNNMNELSFHHLIIPKRDSKKQGIGDGYHKWNGAILVRDTSHDYLHIIERLDRDMFLEITKEMIEENIRGCVDVKNLKRIRDILLSFEREHSGELTSKGKILIKNSYITKRIPL